MIQVTTADIREIKELIERLDNRFNKLEKKVDKLDVSLTARFDELDNRLWLFVMLILGTALTTIVKVFAFPSI